jgi:hypothetical protein
VRFSATYAAFGSPRSLVCCCKTFNWAAVTAEVASSSLVVPAILSSTYENGIPSEVELVSFLVS